MSSPGLCGVCRLRVFMACLTFKLVFMACVMHLLSRLKLVFMAWVAVQVRFHGVYHFLSFMACVAFKLRFHGVYHSSKFRGVRRLQVSFLLVCRLLSLHGVCRLQVSFHGVSSSSSPSGFHGDCAAFKSVF